MSLSGRVIAGRSEASGTPKTRTGPVEATRALRLARRGAVKARTAALNQLHCLIASARESLRAELHGLRGAALVDGCANLTVDDNQLTDPVQATRAALCPVARRVQSFNAEVAVADRRLGRLVGKVAPRTSAIFGVGPDVAGQLLTTAGDNPDRLRSPAALAHLCGAAPIPASSGRTNRHRLNRGGDRAANYTLYTIVLCRMRHDARTRDYVQRPTKEGRTSKDHSMPQDVVPAESAIRAGQAACSYSWRTPPRRSRRWMFSRASWPGSVIGSGSGLSGRTFAIP